MICPKCNSENTRCHESRQQPLYRRRRYTCLDCNERFTTKEYCSFGNELIMEGKIPLSAAALRTFGAERQVRKFCEEMAELQEAVCKTMDEKDRPAHVAEEMADVRIMIHQMMALFCITEEEVEEIRQEKMVRLAKKIKEKVSADG